MTGFTGSLHPLSIVDGVRAAARRTPRRIALVEGNVRLSYAELMQAADRVAAGDLHACAVAQWLGAMIADPASGENRAAAVVREGSELRTLSHREVLLRAFDHIVVHAAFDRDGVMAMPLPFPSAGGVVAVTIALWLGSTVHMLRPGELASLARGIAEGRFHTCWLGDRELAALAKAQQPLAAPADAFVLAVCEQVLSEGLRRRLEDWLGAARIAQ